MILLQASKRLVQDLQDTGTDFYVLKALLLEIYYGGSKGVNLLIVKIFGATDPAAWIHCLVYHLNSVLCQLLTASMMHPASSA